ncbi:MAG: hypothetical protein K6E34_03210 [Lachnospiraceae bacterium]|nr:hypothetical protein [Lachnospiraceae bacterium]
MKKREKKKTDPEIRAQVREIMQGRRELRRASKEAIKNGSWEDIIPMLVTEKDPDVSSYREQLERAGITVEGLREIARHSGARIIRMPETGSLEISLRKSDHSAVVVISKDGNMNTLMRDFLDY